MVYISRVHVFWCFKSIRFYLCRFEVCEFGFELVFRVLGSEDKMIGFVYWVLVSCLWVLLVFELISRGEVLGSSLCFEVLVYVLTPHVLSEWMVEVCRFDECVVFWFRV